MVQQEVNSKSLYKKKLLILIADDAIDPKIGKDLAQRFLNDGNLGIISVVGHSSSTVSLEAAPVYEKGKMVMISPTSINIDLSKSGPYIFRSTPRSSDFAQSLADFIVISKKKSRIATCFDPQIRDSGSFQREFQKNIIRLKKYGAVGLDIGCRKSLNNVSQFDILDPKDISKSVRDQNADAFLVDPYVNKISKAIDFIKQIKKDNKNKLALITNPTMESSDTLELGKDGVIGLLLATVKKSTSFSKKLKLIFSSSAVPTWRATMTYDATKAIVEGLRLSYAKTSDDLQKQLSNESFCVEGAVGTVSFDRNGDRRDPEKFVQIVQVQKTQNAPPIYDFIPLTNFSQGSPEDCKHTTKK